MDIQKLRSLLPDNSMIRALRELDPGDANIPYDHIDRTVLRRLIDIAEIAGEWITKFDARTVITAVDVGVRKIMTMPDDYSPHNRREFVRGVLLDIVIACGADIHMEAR